MGRGARGPSMHDVASLAGVSHQTVSRVLNGFEGIRPETRQRVLDAIEELGYRRNLAARSLATGRTGVVGVLAPDNPTFGATSSLYAVESALRGAGLQPLITTTSGKAESVESALEFLYGRAVEALVVMAPSRSVLEVHDRMGAEVPTAYLLTGDERGVWSVSTDQTAGAELLVETLIEAGHRWIQHVRGPVDSTEAELRAAAYIATMGRRALPTLPVLVGDWSPQSGYGAFARLDPRTTAVFCGNDQMAIGLIHAAVEAGIRVPDDLSVVGFDDIPEAAHTLPPLTTVRQDFRSVGRLAVQLLQATLEGTEQPSTAPLSPQLVARGSVAPPGERG
ncbi:LacI family DNA-binding transcriptional regulator [Demequina capsici]|uniref:LacI family DNA-binding transcriptional regulator n=1 Tax=Demequina capsici TaxID=3075620 RepID=A0AA96FBE9_9MICO|nr:LacI family DNA-binding transcriptional regulator [Demequina sp. PMTSA13]WNM27696.1 LacI family DNA-binding transcriptional regulator [Demequina sp. PMTSA13]